MKKNEFKILILFLLLSFPLWAEKDNMLLKDIIDNISNYKGQTLTLKLKLKYVDKIFEKIIFYDSDNQDIVFDISRKETKKKIEKSMLNLHEGMDYQVTFTVKDTGNLNRVEAEIEKFKPAILENIP